jgi:excisionase family DNA binding protein
MSELLSVGELCEYLRISRPSIYRLTSQRGIPMIKLGNRVLFDRQKIDTWLEGHACGGESDVA